jgi:hypothetical protein
VVANKLFSVFDIFRKGTHTKIAFRNKLMDERAESIKKF